MIGIMASSNVTAGLSDGGGGTAPYETETDAYLAAMSVEPDDTRKSLIDVLIADLKFDGIWTKLTRLALLAAHDSQAALLDAVQPSKSMTAVNSPTFTTDLGYTGNASNAYLDFGELPTVGAEFAQNSACAGVWCNQGSATTGLQYHLGSVATNLCMIRARNDAGNETFTLNDGTAGILQANTGSRAGHRTISRTASNVKRGFMNGVRTANLTTASTGAQAQNLFVLRNTSTYSDDRVAAAYYGQGLTDAEVGNLHSRLSAYLTAIGAD